MGLTAYDDRLNGPAKVLGWQVADVPKRDMSDKVLPVVPFTNSSLVGVNVRALENSGVTRLSAGNYEQHQSESGNRDAGSGIVSVRVQTAERADHAFSKSLKLFKDVAGLLLIFCWEVCLRDLYLTYPPLTPGVGGADDVGRALPAPRPLA